MKTNTHTKYFVQKTMAIKSAADCWISLKVPYFAFLSTTQINKHSHTFACCLFWDGMHSFCLVLQTYVTETVKGMTTLKFETQRLLPFSWLLPLPLTSVRMLESFKKYVKKGGLLEVPKSEDLLSDIIINECKKII